MAARPTCCSASATSWQSTTTAISRISSGCRADPAPAPPRALRLAVMEPRLKSAIRVKAMIRRADIAAIGVAVTARGDPDAGAILLKLIDRASGATVLAQTRRPDGGPEGGLAWLRAT